MTLHGHARRLLLSLLALLVALTGVLAAGVTTSARADETPPAPTAAAPDDDPVQPYVRGVASDAENTTTISGLVRNGVGRLLDGIEVQAFSAADPTGPAVATEYTYEGLEQEHGAFQLHVPAGSYVVRFYDDGPYESTYYGGGAGTPVTVTDEQGIRLDDMVIRRDQGASVSGLVRNSFGEGFADVRVSLFEVRDGNVWDYVDDAYTADDGSYAMGGARANRTYTVMADGSYDAYYYEELGLPDTYLGQQPSVATAETFLGGAAGSELTADAIVLERGAPLTGGVLGLDPGTDASLNVYVKTPDGGVQHVGGSYLQDPARFRYSSVMPGFDYTVAIEANDVGFVGSTWLGDVTTESEATFVSPTGITTVDVGPITVGAGTGSVTVDVVDQDGAPVETGSEDRSAQVRIWERYDYGADETYWYPIASARRVDADTYRARLPRDRVFTFSYVEADDEGDAVREVFLGGGTQVEEARALTVTDTASPLDAGEIVVAEDRTRLTGLVLDDAGAAVAGAQVGVVREDCDTSDDCNTLTRVRTTSADGTYTLRGAPGETVTVGARADGLGYLSLVTAGSTSTFPATGAEIAPDLVLTSAQGVLRGQVTLLDGAALSDAYVYLYRFTDDEVPYFQYQRGAEADENGYYAFTDLEPGSYAVFGMSGQAVGTWRGGTQPSFPDDQGVVQFDGTPVSGIDLRLDPGTVLSGRITDSAGSPISQPQIDAFTWGGGRLSESLGYRTLGDGRYEVRVRAGSEVWIGVTASGFNPSYLGGVAYPDEQTSANTLAVGDDGLTYDVQLDRDWGLLGSVAGSQEPYCFNRDTDSSNNRVNFAGKRLLIGDNGSITLARHGFPSSDLAVGEHLPELSVLPGYADKTRFGVSPDGVTLCAVWTNSVRDPESYERITTSTAQALLTRGTDGGLDVTYNYDKVSSHDYRGSVDRIGYFDGESTAVVFPGSDTPDGYVDGSPTALVVGRLGSDQVGRYTFSFDGFAARRGAPQNTVEPTVSGEAQPGSTVTIDPGTWTLPDGDVADVEYSYSWSDSFGNSSTTASFEIPADAGGRSLYWIVTAWAPGHEPSSYYGSVDVGPDAASNTTPPTFSPLTDVTVGEVLTAAPGTWTPAAGAAPLFYRYQWLRDGVALGRNGRAQTYTVRPRDIGHTLTVEVRADSQGPFRATQSVTSTDSVVVLDYPPVGQTTAPSLSGTAKVGQTLTLQPGVWDAGDATVELRYRWSVDQRVVTPEPSGLSYTLQPGDRRGLVTVTVEARAAGRSVTRWSRTVGPVVAADVVVTPLTVTVLRDDDDSPVADAFVHVCDATTYACFPGRSTGADGTFEVDAAASTTYDVHVYPASDTIRSQTVRYSTPASGPSDVTVSLLVPTPPPANVEVEGSNGTYDGQPVVYYGDPQTFTVTGCAATAAPSYTITFSDGTPSKTGALTRGTTTAGLAPFTVTIPPFYPSHGSTLITTNVPADCDPGTPPTEFSIYIDPSGVVTDQYGFPLQGATVTLNRADTAAGPYAVVPDGSTIMSADNRANPDTTDQVGFFRWDVVEGWYSVTAAQTGCTTATTDPMQVLPARVDLLITLQCQRTPVSPVTPTITGIPQVGNVLTTSTAGLSGFDVDVQWLRGGVPIQGADGAQYAVTGADVGQAITVRHTLQRQDYQQEEGRGTPVAFTPFSALSAAVTGTAANGGGSGGGGGGGGGGTPTGAAPTAITPAAPTGSGKVGTTLTALEPTWSLTGVTTTRQWLRAGTPVDGQTGPTYDVVPADVGQAISVAYTGTKAGSDPGSTISATVTGLVGDAPSASAPAAPTGPAQVGTDLTAPPEPTWSLSAVTTTRQWLRAGDPIDGATGTAYAVTPADVGRAITVRFTGTKAGHAAGTTTSAATTGLLGAAPVATVIPAVTGTPRAGSALTASTGTWTLEGLAFHFQWLRDGAAIGGATSSTYQVVKADVGKDITTTVTASRDGFADGSATSTAVRGQKSAACVTAESELVSATADLASATAVTAGAAARVGVLADKLRKAKKAGQRAKVVRLKKQLKQAKVALRVAKQDQARALAERQQAKAAVNRTC